MLSVFKHFYEGPDDFWAVFGYFWPFLTVFGPFGAQKKRPKWPKTQPKWPKAGQKWVQNGSENGSKNGSFLGDFGQFLGRSGVILVSLSDHFGIVLASFGACLASFWPHFEAFLGHFNPLLDHVVRSFWDFWPFLTLLLCLVRDRVPLSFQCPDWSATRPLNSPLSAPICWCIFNRRCGSETPQGGGGNSIVGNS